VAVVAVVTAVVALAADEAVAVFPSAGVAAAKTATAASVVAPETGLIAPAVMAAAVPVAVFVVVAAVVCVDHLMSCARAVPWTLSVLFLP